MNTTGKVVLGVVVVAFVAGGLWYWYTQVQNTPMTAGVSATPGSGTSGSGESAPSQTTAMPTTTSSASNTSDASIARDTATVDSQMGGLSTDSGNVNSSLNDQLPTL